MNPDLDQVARRLGDLARRDAPIGPLTTYRVGGSAAILVHATSTEHLVAVAAALAGTDVPVLVVGKGSNMLVADAGFVGLAVTLGEPFAEIAISGAAVTAGGAASLPVVARRTAAAGLTGFEWAVGVPGSVGGAVRMNAGGHGSDMAASLTSIRVVDLYGGEDGVVPAADLELAYRHSNLRPAHIVVEARLHLRAGDPAVAEAQISDIVRWRRAHQPGGQNAGSVFTNPEGDSAGRLIDLAGCKGLRRGTAAVSDKHANFIQADDGGSADDVLDLMVEVRRRVHATTGVELWPETHIVGATLPLLDPSR
ncbi:MAG: UDP-N-acetylmuramate dehydrogenase [Acidimicrobiia bacterium]|nr:UDP-N-acetylmuramate dehydrogenase [Acidimicrobiia bacterium]